MARGLSASVRGYGQTLKECLGDIRAIPRRPKKRCILLVGNQGKTSCVGFNVGLASSQAFFLPRVANHENQPTLKFAPAIVHMSPITVETASKTAGEADPNWSPRCYGTGLCHKYRVRMGQKQTIDHDIGLFAIVRNCELD